MNNISNQQIYNFWNDEINNNAPLIVGDKNTLKMIASDFNIFEKDINLKYPYKPFLILSIIEVYKDENIFKTWIDISNSKIVKCFYDFITRDYYLYEILKHHKDKEEWFLGFDGRNTIENDVYKGVLNIIKQSPLRAFKNAKNNNQWIKVNKNEIFIDIKSKFYFDDTKILKSLCISTIKKCIPWYSNLNDNEFIDYQELQMIDNLIFVKKSKQRTFQHLFRKEVLDRDCRCIICCINNANILEACHIKPHSVCNNIEKYDSNNGITLCSNHHKLFDRGFFSFDKEWRVKISKDLKEPDHNMLFKQYEPCFINISKHYSNNNFYIDYHSKNIFRK